MDKVQEMVNAMCEAATTYGLEHGVDNNEIMNALAHTYVIFGFSLRKNDVHQQTLKDALVNCVAESCDRIIEVSADAEEA